MKLLALETANQHCSVAIRNEQEVLFFALDDRAKAQTQSILPLIQQAMQQTNTTWQDISVIAFSRGPGAFSGVRINAAVAQALAWAHDLPVIAVSSLQALAQAAYRQQAQDAYSAVLDARMQEVYVGNFQADAQGIMQLQGQEQLLSYEQAQQFVNAELVGSGAALLLKASQTDQAQLSNVATPLGDIHANAVDIAQLAYAMWQQGFTVSPELALPVYLRDNAWKKIAEQGKADA